MSAPAEAPEVADDPRAPVAPRRTPAWEVGLAFVLIAGVHTAISLVRWRTLSATTFDLGVFTQIVQQWARLKVPVVHLTGDSLIASHHFSPALAVLAPAYAVVPSPVTLLVEQALVVAVGVVPLMRHAGRHGRVLPWAVAVSYGLAPGLCSLVGFDLHEVALAVPLLAFSMTAILDERYRAAVLWALPIVLVKEDLGLTLAAIGFVVLVRGERRLGVLTMVGGLVITAATVLWVLPALDGSAGYYYSDAFAPGSVGEAWTTLQEMLPTKVGTVLVLLAPTALLALGSPLVLVALPTLAWRFTSDRASFWGTGFQYDAVLVPVVVAAMIDTVRRLPRRAVVAVSVVAVAATLFLVPRYDAGDLLHPDRRQAQERMPEVLAALATIPDGARVAASNDLGPRLVSRSELYFFGDPALEVGPVTQLPDFGRIDWIAYDRAYETVVPTGRATLDGLLASGRFRVVTERGGVVVARRTGGE